MARFPHDVVRSRIRSVRAAWLALGCALLVPQSGASGSPASASVVVVVNLNGRKLADGIKQQAGNGEVVLVPVEAVARAVDGAGSTTNRLRVSGRQLLAAAVGRCDSCPVRVARAVVISADVRVVDGVALIPLADLVKAFEGRLEVNAARTVYGIYAGKCTWCILEPQ
jgi:hypothetical protein